MLTSGVMSRKRALIPRGATPLLYEAIDGIYGRMTTAVSPPASSHSYQWRSETRTTTQTTGQPTEVRVETRSSGQQPQEYRSDSRGGGQQDYRNEYRVETRSTGAQPQEHRTDSRGGGQQEYRNEYRVETRSTGPQEYRSDSRGGQQDYRSESRGGQQEYRSESRGGQQDFRADSRASTIPDPVERHVARWRSESRNSNRDRVFKNDDEPSQQDDIVNGTLTTTRDAVEKTTEIIRRKQEQMRIERRQFQTEMEVTGRVSVSPTDDWLSARLKAVSSDDMNRTLGKIKHDQRQNAVTDTLAALVYDVNATAEVLRRGSLGRKKEGKDGQRKEEIEYRLRLTPAPDEIPAPRPRPVPEENYTVDEVSRDYGVEMSESQTAEQRRRRARSETPRRTLQIEGSPPPSAPIICNYCSEEIDGPILTALAPNSDRAQKFHTYHFMCTYCQKTLNMHGTYREHGKKPYCHDCFYRLYNGLQYQPDEHQAGIEKLI